MTAPIPVSIRSQTLWVSAGRSLFWEEESTLIVSDLHFGKTGHFRKAGIPVPPQVNREDLQRLIQEAVHFRARRLILTGDLFHSDENLELALFARWREGIPVEETILVRGNHDVLRTQAYEELGLTVHARCLVQGPFRFVHDPDDPHGASPNLYTLAGHLHPGIRLSGLGRQSLRLPCFFFGTDTAILPAFSRFTGLALLEPSLGEHVIAVVPGHSRGSGPATLVRIR
jgi:DNA ligase-associated metallophosphoesterase